MTSRELVKKTLNFENKTGRVPRMIVNLPWAEMYEGEMLQKIRNDFPNDFANPPVILKKTPFTQGNSVEIGTYIDEWGCKYENIHRGVMGEVKEALVKDEDWDDWENVHIPTELLDFDVEAVNAFCKSTDKYVNAGAMPNVFERLQFIRTTEQLYMDLVDPPKNMLKFMDKMFSFYYDLMEKWAKTDVDQVGFLDDWGSQNSLLISPAMWEKYFAPFYKEIIDIGHRHGKDVWSHSDGNILAIYPKFIEMGLDALNSQIFCMGLENLEQFKGKITFHGEIDRQYLLPFGSTEDIQKAVKDVQERFWDNGGVIAECEFGPGAKPENVYTVYETWNKLR